MKLKILFTIFVLILTASIASVASTKSIYYPIQEIIGVSFDINKNLEMTANILYPNGCFHPKNTYATLNKEQNTIEIHHSALILEGICTQSFVQKFQNFALEKPDKGTYQVLDSTSQKYLGDLVVEEDSTRFIPEIFCESFCR